MMRRRPEWLSIDVKRLCGSAVSKLQIEHRFSKEFDAMVGALCATAFCRQRVKLPAARPPSLAGQKLQLSKVYAGHHPDNHASEKILKKLGLELIENVFIRAHRL